jgi:hypothetical protein
VLVPDEPLGAAAEPDQLGDAQPRQAVDGRELVEPGAGQRHTVVPDELGDHHRAVATRHPGEVDRRLGVPSAAQHAAPGRARSGKLTARRKGTTARHRIGNGPLWFAAAIVDAMRRPARRAS